MAAGVLYLFCLAGENNIKIQKEKDENAQVSVLFATPKRKWLINYATAYTDSPMKIRIVTSVPIDSVVEI